MKNEKKQDTRKKPCYLKKLKGFFPEKLPVGMTEFDRFADSIFKTYGLPDGPSYRQAIAALIMHLDSVTDKAPKRYFAKSIRKSMANQVAYEQIQQIKAKEKLAEEELARKEQQQTEATPN